MRKLYLIVALMALALTGCEKEGCNPEQNTATFAKSKTIAIQYNEAAQQNYHQVVDGSNLVFEFHHNAAECDDTMDDEWGYLLAFEVDKDATHFRFEGSELASSKAFYREYGAWVGGGTRALNSGVIEGTRISDSKWRIKVNVIAPPLSPSSQLKQIVFERVFVK